VSEAGAVAKRARTDEQKKHRRRTILQAADAHLREGGFEAFSMAEVGKRAGVAKGTLYLYFETREEVLLALYCEKLEAWEALLDAAVRNSPNDRKFAAVFYEALYADPSLLPLMSRLDSVIEHNVSIELLIDSKRAMAALLGRLSESLAPRLHLSPAQAFDALRSLGSLLLGAAQVDAGPRLNAAVLPDDVRQFMEAFSSQLVFTTNACRILAGIRAGS